jgi:hypothetical protein
MIYTAQSNVKIFLNILYRNTVRIIMNPVGSNLVTYMCRYENGNALPDIRVSILQRMEYMFTI